MGACAHSLCEGAAGTAGETDLGVYKHLGAGGRAGSRDEVLTARATRGWAASSSTCPGVTRPPSPWLGAHECKQRTGYAWEMGLLRSKEVSRAEGVGQLGRPSPIQR